MAVSHFKNLKKYLDSLSKAELEAEIIKLCRQFKGVKLYYQIDLSGDSNVQLQKVKDKISKLYTPLKGNASKINSKCTTIISQFSSSSVFQMDLVDLLLHRVECGNKAISKNRYRSASFYLGLIKSFHEAYTIMKRQNYTADLSDRCGILVEDAKKGTQDYQKRLIRVMTTEISPSASKDL